MSRVPLNQADFKRAFSDGSGPPAAAQGEAVPANTIELEIAAIWSRLLNVTPVTSKDNFFDLGGHSLLAQRAVQEIKRITGAKIETHRLIFETLGQIAASIAIDPGHDSPTDVLAGEVHAGSDAANALTKSASRPHWLKRLWSK